MYGIFKKYQIGAGRTPVDILNTTFSFFKQPLVLKIHLGMFFDSRNSKMVSKLPLNLLVLGYRQILSKFTMRYISVKKNVAL